MKIQKNHTNTEKDIQSAIQLLAGTEISILDAARLIKNALDFKPKGAKASDIVHCTKVINSGISHLHIKEMNIAKGFDEYIKTKMHLRKASFNDIKYIGKRLLNNAKYSKLNFSELTLSDCQKWLDDTYQTPSQYNKAHRMLNGLFNYALRQEWADRNVVKLVQKRKVIETEIKALTLPEINALLATTKQSKYQDCQAAVALQIWAGIRPQELQRLSWQDVDLEENVITIRPTTSKTGGSRHIEICKPLKTILKTCQNKLLVIDNSKTTNLMSDSIAKKSNEDPFSVDTRSSILASPIERKIIPRNWEVKWKSLRKDAGFLIWTQDVLRHTYASYHLKYFGDLTRLQLNMGHTSLQLLRTRYVNLHNVTKDDAKTYFSAIN